MATQKVPLIFALAHLHIEWDDNQPGASQELASSTALLQGTREIPQAGEKLINEFLARSHNGTPPEPFEFEMLKTMNPAWGEELLISFHGITQFGAGSTENAETCAANALNINKNCKLAKQLVSLLYAKIEVRCPPGVNAEAAPDVPDLLANELHADLQPLNNNAADEPQQAEGNLFEIEKQLVLGAENGRLEDVQAALTRGADVDAVDPNGSSALYFACANGHIEIIHTLIDKGAKIDQINQFGESPIFPAAFRGRTNVIELLAGMGADINLKDKKGRTPLITSIIAGHERAVRALLLAGADPDSEYEGVTARNFAAALGNPAIAEQLQPIQSSESEAKFRDAVVEGDVETVRSCINSGIDVNAAGPGGITPLFVSAAKGKQEVVATLIEHGANVDPKNENGLTPLLIAAYEGHLGVVQALVCNGADTTATINGETPFEVASRRGHGEIARLLEATKNKAD